MTKSWTTVLATLLAVTMVLAVSAPEALAFRSGPPHDRITDRQSLGRRVGRGLEGWAKQRWQSMQGRNPRLTNSQGGLGVVVGLVGAVVSMVQFSYAAGWNDGSGMTLWGGLGLGSVLLMLGSFGGGAATPKK